VGRGSVGMPPFAPMIAVHAAEVDVDRETGKVKVLSYIAAQDAGKAINPWWWRVRYRELWSRDRVGPDGGLHF